MICANVQHVRRVGQRNSCSGAATQAQMVTVGPLGLCPSLLHQCAGDTARLGAQKALLNVLYPMSGGRVQGAVGSRSWDHIYQ